ncbi:MAG TPA: lipid-A-disaccharide synthase [Candidatus Deferrimicrobiaceae bacterium]
MNTVSKSLFVVCGEPSGETYAVNAVREFRRRFPQAPVRGIGSDRLRAEGVELVADYSGISVVGITEVIRHLPEIRRTLRLAMHESSRLEVGAVLLVDFPDFNFRVGKHAARAGKPVVYFIPPQLWAWRKGRARQLAEFTKGVVVAFPFEEETLCNAGVAARFAGHPLIDELSPFFDAPPCPGRFGIPEGSTVVGLLPGSRSGEIRRHFPLMVDAARRIAEVRPDCLFAIPVASSRFRSQIEDGLAGSGLKAVIVDKERHLLFRSMSAAISASGTATLELALLGVPHVIVYRISPLTYLVGRMLVSVKSIGLPNLIAGTPFLPELIQGECNPGRMASEMLSILADDSRRARLSAQCIALRERLRGSGPTAAVVDTLVKVSEGAWA